MKKILSILLIFIAGTVAAQNTYIGSNDPAAWSILNKVSAKHKAYQTSVADFSLSVENSQGKVMSKRSGKLETKGKKFRLTLDGDISFSDGANMYQYDKAANEVMISRVNPKDNMLTPQKLFTNFYEKDFLFKLNDEVTRNGKALQIVELTPVDKTQPYFKVLLEVEKATSHIAGARIFEKNGNRYYYQVRSFKANSPVADARFKFDQSQFKGAEIVDLR